MIEEGDEAPDFTLPADDGSTVTLSDLQGRPVVVYFYPKDDTPGCTKEACAFRDRHPAFDDRDAVVLGISQDPLDSHREFKDDHDLPFLLLSDEDGEVCEAYDVLQEKEMFGNTFLGIVRSTFLVGPDGTVEQAWHKVDVDGHADEVLEAVRAL